MTFPWDEAVGVEVTDVIEEQEQEFLERDGRCPGCFHRFAFHVSCDRGDYCLIKLCECDHEAPRYRRPGCV